VSEPACIAQFREAMGSLGEAGADRSRVMDRVFPLVYPQLRRLAEQKFARESPGHTLQPTALVHEAWLRLVEESGPQWAEPKFFFAAAAEAMRRILIEHARVKNRAARSPWKARVALDSVDLEAPFENADWPVLDEAIESLRAIDLFAAEVARLRVYAGLTVAGAAAALGVSESTVKREWDYARAWLRVRLEDLEP
jgi:RNA polymerase sigma factor (TIGR02999 family)